MVMWWEVGIWGESDVSWVRRHHLSLLGQATVALAGGDVAG